MTRFLLDVNVVLALLDPRHVFHDDAHRWAESSGDARWLICPTVQNSVLRIAGLPSYPNSLGTVSAVRELLREFTQHPRHVFIPDDITLLDDDVIKPERLTPSTLTDIYLLRLAQQHHAKLATFDQRIPTDAIQRGSEALELISAI
jgi:uncharacterized protein